MKSRLISLLLLLISAPLLSPVAAPVAAMPPSQANCGIIDSPDDIGMPLDPKEFQLIQPFGRASSRFDGKLHAGEDWIGKRGRTYGEPVYAIAPGRVTYSDPLGWGRDKGVVIIQHQFLDGTFIYSLYGHMEEVEEIEFVEGGSCVEKGDVVGAIGSPRPAPHLHFEIRSFSPNAPGPGYWDLDPRVRGWYNPRQFVANWQAWLSPSYAWRVSLEDPIGPILPDLVRPDGVQLMIDGNLLRAYNGDGGRLWQFGLGDFIIPIAFSFYGDEELIIAGSEGRIQFWNTNGSLLDSWFTRIESLAQVIVFGDLLFLRSTDDTLFIFDGERDLVREYTDIVEITSYAATDKMLALITANTELLLFAPDGDRIDRDEVSIGSDVIAAPDGGIYLRDQGSFEYIDADGDREVLRDELTVNRSDRAMIVTSEGNIVMWGINGRERLMSLSPDGDILWETDVEEVSPNLLRVHLVQANECTLALADRRGRIFTFNLEDGEQSGRVDVWGTHQNGVHLVAAPDDPRLRVHIADQLVAFDTRILSNRVCGAD